MADNIPGFRVDANVNPFEQAMRRMVDAARGGQGGVADALGSLGGPLAGLKVAFQASSVRSSVEICTPPFLRVPT